MPLPPPLKALLLWLKTTSSGRDTSKEVAEKKKKTHPFY
jgi:hypothetical protein